MMYGARRHRIQSYLIGVLFLCVAVAGWSSESVRSLLPFVSQGEEAMGSAASMRPDSLLRIATFNIRHGRGLDDVVNLQRIATWILSDAIDIVVLQEVDDNWPRSGFESQIERLAELTGFEHWVYAPALQRSSTNGARHYGNAVLSRYPLDSTATYPLPQHFASEPRNVVRVEVALDAEAPLVLWGTHLSTRPSERREQLRHLSALVVPTERALILGDFNTTADDEHLQHLIASGWIDTWPHFHSEPGPTFPSDRPSARIDFILASPRLIDSLRGVSRPLIDASDHLPVVVELAIGTTAPARHP